MTKNPNSGADNGLPTIAQLCDQMNQAEDAMGAYVTQVNAGPHSAKTKRDGVWTRGNDVPDFGPITSYGVDPA